MTFEPYKVLSSVLDFYYTSGIANPQDVSLQKTLDKPFLVHGLKQKYEQILFFLSGHLIPDFLPLIVNVEKTTTELGASAINTTFSLKKITKSSAQAVQEQLDSDERLQKLLNLSNAHTSCEFSTQASQTIISLWYPVDGIMDDPNGFSINFDELRTRYDSIEDARILLEGFVMNARRHITLLTSAVQKQEFTEAFRHAHALKGGAMTVCADDLAHKATVIEVALKEQRYKELQNMIVGLDLSCTELESTWSKHREAFYGKV